MFTSPDLAAIIWEKERERERERESETREQGIRQKAGRMKMDRLERERGMRGFYERPGPHLAVRVRVGAAHGLALVLEDLHPAEALAQVRHLPRPLIDHATDVL